MESRARPSLRPALVLVALLLVQGLLVVAPPVAAQDERQPLRQSGSLLPEAENEQLVFTDAAGDAGLFLTGSTPTPENEFEKIVDILSLSLAETDDRFLFKLEHASYDPQYWDLTAGADGLGSFSCYLRWQINGQDAVTYSAGFYVQKPSYGEAYMQGWSDRRESRGDSYDYEYVGSFYPTIVDDDHIEFTLDKEGFKVGTRGRDLIVDDRLTDFQTRCYYQAAYVPFAGYYDYTDDLPGEGSGRYHVKSATGSDRLALHLDDPDDDEDRRLSAVSLAPGVAKRSTVWVENIGDTKALANLTVDVRDRDGDRLEDWKVVVPPVVEVPSGESTKASLVITAPEDAAHRDYAQVVVEARAIGHEGVVGTKVHATVAEPLGPEQDTLFFHDPFSRYFSCIIICGGPVDTSQVTAVDTDWHYYTMNPLDDDPRSSDEAREGAVVRFDSRWDMEARLDVPLVKPVRLDPDGRIELDLGIGAEVEHEATVRVDLQAYDRRDRHQLGRGQTTATLTPGSQTVTVSMTPHEEASSLPAGTDLWLIVDVEPVLPLSFVDLGVDWYPDDTTLTFPFIAVDDAQLNLTDGRAFPSIQTANGTDTEEHVNPGKTQVFDLRLVNEGSEEDVLTMDLETDDDAWSVHVEPGNRFKLGPGRSAPLSVLVTAPEDAVENDMLTLNLTATSKNDADVRTSLRLKAIVTSGITIDDEAYVEPAAEDKIDPYLDDSEESPAPPAMALLVALTAMGLFLRRRLH